MVKANYITVDEFTNFNPGIDTSRYTTTTISGMISRASSWIDNYLGYSLQAEPIVGEVSEGIIDSYGDLVVFPKKIPVISVQGIRITRGTNFIDLNLVDVNNTSRINLADEAKYIVYPREEFSFQGASIIVNFYELRGTPFSVDLDYTAGWNTIPDDLKDACNLITRDQFARSANPLGASRIQQGAVSYAFDNGSRGSDGDSDNIRDAKQILNNYVRMASIA